MLGLDKLRLMPSIPAWAKEGERTGVCVIGTGYVGLVTGVVLSHLGNDVVCVDADAQKIGVLNAGEMPIYEPGLEEMVRENVEEGRLSFTTDLGGGVRSSEVVLVAVGTPPGPNGEPDMTQVIEATRAIAANLNGYKVIANKSTVPIGTGGLVSRIIEENKTQNVRFDVVSNPEFLREGSAIHDALYPDRVIIGADSQGAAMRLVKLYAPLERPMVVTDVTSAEIIKYASNAFLASKISFINSIATLCEKVGGDVQQVSRGMGYDHRIGQHFLQAGLGFGGSCFGKDVKALIHTLDKLDCDCSLLSSVLEINDSQPARFVERVRSALGGLDGRRVALLGLAFKPNTDDMRDAKSVDLMVRLLAGGAEVCAYDPIAAENCRRVFPQVSYCADPYEACRNASAALLVTEWDEFKSLDFVRLRGIMQRPVLFDGRNFYDPRQIRRMGFEYHGIGRAAPAPAEVSEVSARAA